MNVQDPQVLDALNEMGNRLDAFEERVAAIAARMTALESNLAQVTQDEALKHKNLFNACTESRDAIAVLTVTIDEFRETLEGFRHDEHLKLIEAEMDKLNQLISRDLGVSRYAINKETLRKTMREILAEEGMV